MKFADISKRFLALLIDGLIGGVIQSMLIYLLGGYSYLITIVGLWLYSALMESSTKQATLGKMALGIVVTDMQGNRITFAKATGRYFAKMLSGTILCIGYILAFTNDRKQALHDSMAGTLVLDRQGVVAQPSYAQPYSAPVNRGYAPPPPSNVTPVLYGLTGEFSGRSIPLDDRGIMIGRDASICQVAFSDNTPGISRRHCTLNFNRTTGSFMLVDIGSSFGTFLESGMKVIQGQAVNLRPGDRFFLAERSIMFEVRL